MPTAENKPPAAAPRPRPYRDFLTPLLHRRFTSAALLTACLCYAEAVVMGDWKSPWEWFSLAVVRALCLILSTLSVFILRMAHLHLGSRNTVSPLENFWKQCFGAPAFRTFLLYFLSSLTFFETYVWFAAPDMGLVDHGKAYERDRVNERSVYMRTVFLVVLPSIQTVLHLYGGYDTVSLPTCSTQEKNPTTNSISRFMDARPVDGRTALRSVVQAGCTTVAGTVIYWSGLHDLFWRLQYSVARTLFLVPKGTGPRTLVMGDFIRVLGQSIFQGTLIVLLWSTVNALFNFYISKEPLKKDQPITNDSKDPNGSLLIGLKSRKEIPRTFAFWELSMITQRFDIRRKTIFEEVERSNGSTWKQILQVSLAEIGAISKRIEATKPAPPAPPAPTQSESIQTLPRISSHPLREDNILSETHSPASRLDKIANFARSHGSSPGGPPVSPKAAMKFIESTTDKVASRVMRPDHKAKIQQQGVAGFFAEIFFPLVRAPYIGQIFRQTFRRRANVIIASAPYSRISTITYAVTSVVELAVQSLKEDVMGQVSRDVPTIIRTLGSTISSVEGFLKSLEPHWTDIDFTESDRKAVPEVEHLLEILRDGLKKLLIAHGEYLEMEGMSRVEIRDVKALVGSEMKERK